MNQNDLIAYASKTDPFRFKLGRVTGEPNMGQDYLPILRERTVPRDTMVHGFYKNNFHFLRLTSQSTYNYFLHNALVIVMTNGYWRIGRVSIEDTRMVKHVLVRFANGKTNLIPIKDVYEVAETQLPEPYATMLPREDLE